MLSDDCEMLESIRDGPKREYPIQFPIRRTSRDRQDYHCKKMGKFFYDLGFLAKAEVVECLTTNIFGQFVGQTGPKVQQIMEKALREVLFIDEAYRITKGSSQ